MVAEGNERVAKCSNVILELPQTIAYALFLKPLIEHGQNAVADFGWHWLFLKGGPDTFGFALGVLCLASVIWALNRRSAETIALAAFVMLTAFGLTRSHLAFDRYYPSDRSHCHALPHEC
jgi:hypothetical protein